jgi:MerR family mercuric resistance operon transcriptional regulator
MKISEFAKSVDISVETVRYYHREGLLKVPTNSVGNRQYLDTHAKQILFIKNAKLAGFSLAEVKQLNTFNSVTDKSKILALSEEKKVRLEKEIAELKSAMAFLDSLVTECKASYDEPCPILEGLKYSAATND